MSLDVVCLLTKYIPKRINPNSKEKRLHFKKRHFSSGLVLTFVLKLQSSAFSSRHTFRQFQLFGNSNINKTILRWSLTLLFNNSSKLVALLSWPIKLTNNVFIRRKWQLGSKLIENYQRPKTNSHQRPKTWKITTAKSFQASSLSRWCSLICYGFMILTVFSLFFPDLIWSNQKG